MQTMIVVDVSIVTIALPSIQSDLDIHQSRLGWVINAYTIGFGGLLLLAGRLGDLIGRKTVFSAGVAAFTVASALSGSAWSQEFLIATRFIQGVGAGLAYAVAMSIVITLFTEPRERGRALGLVGFAQAAGASVGIVLGGVLSHAISWHWVFYVNVPIGIVASVLAVRLIPKDSGIGLRAGLDVIGAVLATAGLMLGAYAIVIIGDHGWNSPHALAGLVSLALLGGFILRQTTARVPLVPLGFLRNRALAGGNIIHILTTGSTVPFTIMIALYFQQVAGYSPLHAAFALMPLAIASAFTSLAVYPRLASRFDSRRMLAAGLTVVASGLLLAARLPADPLYTIDILPAITLVGAGSGIVMPAVIAASMAVRDLREAGLASGVAATSGMIGDTAGIAALTTLAAAHTAALLNDGLQPVPALNDGFHLAFGTAAALAAIAVAIAFLLLRRPDARNTPAPH
ncbi:MFS transporter [Marinitenerispora sediminis]|uniref:MFS transporter n=1 Tax=Marinitenerispora sediminis TaxID=1931232 RepID=A0A368T3C0_9ACTN|nr:MFS transporter [Marinitenerispora sediminis]RCV49378.1 MFS transporter [Marinitenerispora sediminis]RCV56002.1 MFS transporter [Marinitenerispora sediminis]RCV56612.1 MFS transporter [Marinitenerispora sediminis]